MIVLKVTITTPGPFNFSVISYRTEYIEIKIQEFFEKFWGIGLVT